MPRDDAAKARENRARRHVAAKGFVLARNRSRTPGGHGHGLYAVLRPGQEPSRFDLDIDAVEAWLASTPGAPPRRAKYVYDEALHVSGATSAPLKPEGEPVLSALRGGNLDLLNEVRRLWVRPDDLVLDMTYGTGIMWGKPEPGQPPQIRHDLLGDGIDCRHLPEDSSSVDVVAFDPPYRATHGASSSPYRPYSLAETGLASVPDILDLYEDGIREAARVLRPGARLLVKCMDVSHGAQGLQLVHVDILRMMHQDGLALGDLFVLVNTSRRTSESHLKQKRARRSHSYLIVAVK